MVDVAAGAAVQMRQVRRLRGAVVGLSAVLPLAVDVWSGAVGVLSALDQLRLQLGVNVGQVDDEHGPVGRLVGAGGVVAMEDAHVVGGVVRPELLEVLAHDMLTMAGVVQRHLVEKMKHLLIQSFDSHCTKKRFNNKRLMTKKHIEIVSIDFVFLDEAV